MYIENSYLSTLLSIQLFIQYIHNKIKIEMLLPSLLLISMMAGSSVSLSLMVSGYNRNLTKLQLTPNYEVRFLN